MLIAGATLMSVTAFAQIVVDGTAEGLYGDPLAVQDTPTGFGDSFVGLVDFATGSEIDGIFAKIEGGNLYVVVSGNLESNFNKLELFIDTGVPGQNKLRGDNADVDFNGLNRMGDDGSGNGLTFDADFSPKYWFSVTGGDNTTYNLYANAAILEPGGGGYGAYAGTTTAASDGTLSGGDNFQNYKVTINNSNAAGVTDFSIDGAGDVRTGVEFCIPLASLGNPSSMKISAMVNGLFHDYLSNQVIAGVGGLSNLAEPRAVNFANIAGNQYVQIGSGPITDVLAPTSYTLGPQGAEEGTNDVSKVTTSDDIRAVAFNTTVANNNIPSIRYTFFFTSPVTTGITELKATFENQSQFANHEIRGGFVNASNNNSFFDVFTDVDITPNVDKVRVASLTNPADIAAVVAGDGTVKTALRGRKVGVMPAQKHRLRVDMAKLEVTHN